MQDKLTFKADLWDGFHLVVKSEANGVVFYKELCNYFKKRAQIEEEYAKSLSKLHQKSNTPSGDEIEASGYSFGEAWSSIERAAQAEGQAHAQFATYLMEAIVEPSKLMIKECDEKLKSLQAEGQKYIGEQQFLLKNLYKSRLNAQKLTKDVESAKSALDEASKDSKQSKEVPKLEKRLQKCTQEADAAGADCRHQEVETKNYLRSYYSDYMPRVMEELEKLDNNRLTNMSGHVQKFISLLEEVPRRVSMSLKPMQTFANAVNVDQDIQQFIKKNTSHSKPPSPESVVDLPVSSEISNSGSTLSSSGGASEPAAQKPAKKKSLAAKFTTNFKMTKSNISVTPPKPGLATSHSYGSSSAPSPKVVSIFGMKLEDIMKKQEFTAPTLEIPLPLLVLAHGILKQNGAFTEGVFRVSAPSSELNRLLKQFDVGHYGFDFSEGSDEDELFPLPSVHAMTGAFKRLLRDAPNSLIPMNLYDKAIALETLDNVKEVHKMVASLPSLNRKVMMFLIRYLQEFLHSDCVEKSKMTLDNIAMVFAPTVLRSPTEDLNVMVANSLREKSFVRVLLETEHSFAWWALPDETPSSFPASATASPADLSPRLTLDILQMMLEPFPLSPFTSTASVASPIASPSHSPLSSSFSSPSLRPSVGLSNPSALPLSSLSSSNLSDSGSYSFAKSYSVIDLDNDSSTTAPIPIPQTRDRSWTTAINEAAGITADTPPPPPPELESPFLASARLPPPPTTLPPPPTTLPPPISSFSGSLTSLPPPPPLSSSPSASHPLPPPPSSRTSLPPLPPLPSGALSLSSLNLAALSSDLEGEISKLKEEVAKESAARATAEEERKHFEQEKKKLEEETERLSHEKTEQRIQIDALRVELDAVRATHETTQEALRAQEAIRAREESTQRELADARAEAARAKAEAQKLVEEVQKKEKEIEKRDKEIEERKVQVEAKAREVEEKKKEVEEHKREVEEKKIEVSAKIREIEERNQEVATKKYELEEKNKEVEQRIREVEEKTRLVREKTQEAEAAWQEAEFARGEGERAKQIAEGEAQRIKKEMEDAKRAADAARAELDRARADAERLKVEQVEKAVEEEPVEGEEEVSMDLDDHILERVRVGSQPAIASASAAVGSELIFLAERIAFAYEMPLLMELSKILRSVRQNLDATLYGAGIEEWQVAQFSRAYVTCELPSYSIDHVPIDMEPAAATARPADPYSDPEKVKKVRTIALQAVRGSIELLYALVVKSILGGNTSGQTIHIKTQLSALASRLLTADQKLNYLKREARGTVLAADYLAKEVRTSFSPSLPLEVIVDLARPIIALVKDLDTFFAWAGLEVPPLGSPPPDDRITDDRMRRVRSMLFMALQKVLAQSVLMRNSLEGLAPDDPRVAPILERIHLVVDALRIAVPQQQ